MHMKTAVFALSLFASTPVFAFETTLNPPLTRAEIESAAFACGSLIATRTIVDALPKSTTNEALLTQMAKGTEQCLLVYPDLSRRTIDNLMK
jgi:hypothetical protein